MTGPILPFFGDAKLGNMLTGGLDLTNQNAPERISSVLWELSPLPNARTFSKPTRELYLCSGWCGNRCTSAGWHSVH